jgi:hypothetical protein
MSGEDRSAWGGELRKRHDLQGAVAAGIAKLSDGEREWIDEDSERRDDLDRRLEVAHSRLLESVYSSPGAAQAVGLVPPFDPAVGLLPGQDPWAPVAVAEWLWLAVRDQWREANAAELAAAQVAAEKRAAGESLDTRARDRLTTEVRERLRGEHPAVSSAPWWRGAPIPPDEVGDIYPADESAALYFEHLGDEGTDLRRVAGETAAALRSTGRSEIAAWRAQLTIPGPPTTPPPWECWTDRLLFPRLLARALWDAVVKPQLDREAATQPAALSLFAWGHIQPMQRRGLRLDIAPGADVRVLRDDDGTDHGHFARTEPLSAPTVDLDQLDKLLVQGVTLLGSLNGSRLLHFEVVTGHRQVVSGNPDPRKISVEGGWSGLAKSIGAPSKKAADEVHALVVAQAHARFTLHDGTYGNQLSYTVGPARRGRSSMVSLILGDVLLPSFIFGFAGLQSRTARDDRKLVPMLAELPPLVGSRQLHGPQAALHSAVMIELRRRAVELVTAGGVRLTLDDFCRLAEPLGLSVKILPQLLDRWTQDGPDGPAFLSRVGPDLYTLGDSHRAARDFLISGGKEEIRGQAKGRRGVKDKLAPHRVKK